MDISAAAREMGRKSVKVRMKDMTEEQRKEYMRQVRAKKTPIIKNEAILGA